MVVGGAKRTKKGRLVSRASTGERHVASAAESCGEPPLHPTTGKGTPCQECLLIQQKYGSDWRCDFHVRWGVGTASVCRTVVRNAVRNKFAARRTQMKEYLENSAKSFREKLSNGVPSQDYKSGFDVGYALGQAHAREDILNRIEITAQEKSAAQDVQKLKAHIATLRQLISAAESLERVRNANAELLPRTGIRGGRATTNNGAAHLTTSQGQNAQSSASAID